MSIKCENGLPHSYGISYRCK